MLDIGMCWIWNVLDMGLNLWSLWVNSPYLHSQVIDSGCCLASAAAWPVRAAVPEDRMLYHPDGGLQVSLCWPVGNNQHP